MLQHVPHSSPDGNENLPFVLTEEVPPPLTEFAVRPDSDFASARIQPHSASPSAQAPLQTLVLRPS